MAKFLEQDRNLMRENHYAPVPLPFWGGSQQSFAADVLLPREAQPESDNAHG
jgi:hypothetical protein